MEGRREGGKEGGTALTHLLTLIQFFFYIDAV